MDMDWGKEAKGALLPEGTYKVRIDTFERTTAKTGTAQIKWKARILEPVEFEGKTITDFTALTEKALWRVAWLVSACGVEIEKLGKMGVESSAFNRVLKSCEGRTAFWHLKIGLSNTGVERNEIDDYKKDEEQESITGEEDVPGFLKE